MFSKNLHLLRHSRPQKQHFFQIIQDSHIRYLKKHCITICIAQKHSDERIGFTFKRSPESYNYDDGKKTFQKKEYEQNRTGFYKKKVPSQDQGLSFAGLTNSDIGNLVKTACSSYGPEGGLRVIYTAEKSGEDIPSDVYSYVLNLMAQNPKTISLAIKLYENIKEKKEDIKMSTIIMKAYVVLGRMNNAIEIFEHIKEKFSEADPHCYTVMINAYCRSHKLDSAFKLLSEMKEKNLKPTLVTYNTMLGMLVKEKLGMQQALDFFYSFSKEHPPDTGSYSILVDGFCKRGMTEEAEKVIADMKKNQTYPNVVTYTSLLNGYLKQDQQDKALELLQTMKQNRETFPNSKTYASMINYLCKVGNIHGAFDIVSQMRTHGIEPTIITYNIILNALAVRGRMDTAESLLEEMRNSKNTPPDTASYNCIAVGYRNLGRLDKVTEVLNRMKSDNIQPTPVTLKLIESIKKRNKASYQDECLV